MRVAVVGACGTIGPAIVADLGRSEEVAELLLLDLHREAAESVAERYGNGKARGAVADAGAGPGEPGSLADAIAECDALVNAASYRVNLGAMEACLHAGAHYLDLGGLYWVAAEQVRTFAPPEQDRFAERGLLAVLGIGSAPGKTNLMGVRAVRELARPGADPATPAREPSARVTARPPGSLAEDVTGVDSMRVSAAGRDLDPPQGFSIPYALRTLIDELTLRPVVIRDGEAVEIDPLSDGGVVEFGDVIGAAETIITLHSEMLSFPDSFGCREASFRLSLAPNLLARLRELADAPAVDIERAAAEAVPPSPKTVAVHLVEADAGERSARVRSVTRPVDELGFGGGVTSTAAPAAATVRLLARGRVGERGVRFPERCIDPDDLFAELEQRGSRFDVEVSETASDRAAPGREAEEAARP